MLNRLIDLSFQLSDKNIMRKITIFFPLLGYLHSAVGIYVDENLDSTSKMLQNGRVSVSAENRILTNIMMPGDRVSAMDKDGAICSADIDSDQNVEIERTEINYYYAIESTTKISTEEAAGRSMIRLLEDKLFRAIRPALLWCYFDESPSFRRDLQGDNLPSLRGDGSEKRETFRRLVDEEARRLSIVSFSTSPEDDETQIGCNFPSSYDGYCVVMHGMVTIMHHITSDVRLAAASIHDSTQKAMDYSNVFFQFDDGENVQNITNIEWLGETQQEAIDGGPNGYGVVVVGGETNEIIAATKTTQEEDDKSLLAYALSIPLIILMLLMLLITRNKAKRKVKTKEQILALQSFDNVVIGTGDPPGSYHKGMYHFTSDGARYLSTVCSQCIETKQNGFFTAGGDDGVCSVVSDHRNRFLVNPSEFSLGVKHSSIDVHNCSSARCPICTYKGPKVEFISKSGDFEPVRSGKLEV